MSPAATRKEKTGNRTSAEPLLEQDAVERAQIDRSTRLPVLFFFTSAMAWLVFASLTGMISSIKLNAPDVFQWGAWIEYGRLYPVHINSLLYGWAMQAGFGVSIWMMARLCRVPLKNPWTLVVAGHFWNLGVTAGVLGILCGKGTSMFWLDFPSFVWPLLLLSNVLIVVWMIVMFRARREGEVYISQWYLLAAFFLFPWIYGTANVFLHVFRSTPVIGAAINAWYSSSLIFLWFVPVGLASSYYLLPKIVGRPVANYDLAKAGFWALMILGGWTGMQRFMGGPLPAWMTTLGGAATILVMLPMLMAGLNHHMTVKGNIGYMQYSPTLRFTIFGAWALNGFVIMAAAMSFFSVGKILQFTHAVTGMEMAAIYGFFTMTMFGAMYFIAPRVTGCEWLSGGIIRFHFWFSAYGIIFLTAFMIFGGLAQGASMADWQVPFQFSVEKGWGYLVARSLMWGFILMSNVVFLFHVLLMSVRLSRRSQMEPTLIHKLPEEEEGADFTVEGAKA